jgi:transposase
VSVRAGIGSDDGRWAGGPASIWRGIPDVCEQNGLLLLLGNPRSLGRFYRAWGKDDPNDAVVIAQLLRTGLFPAVADYPRHLSRLRELLRARLRLVRQRTGLATYLQATDDGGEASVAVEQLTTRDEYHQAGAAAQSRLLDSLDSTVESLDGNLARGLRQYFPAAEGLLRSIPGVGLVTAATVLLEVGNIHRFRSRQGFRAYCRLAPRTERCGGRVVGRRDPMAGHRLLRWALGLAGVNGARHHDRVARLLERLRMQYGPNKAEAVLAGKYADAVWAILRREEEFDIERFVRG